MKGRFSVGCVMVQSMMKELYEKKQLGVLQDGV